MPYSIYFDENTVWLDYCLPVSSQLDLAFGSPSMSLSPTAFYFFLWKKQ